MLRTAQRGTHRAEGPAVIDYGSLLAPVSKGAVGAAALTAVAATAATGLGFAPANAAPSTHNGPVSQAGTKLPSISALGSKPLRTGHRGQQVQALQSLLNHHGASIKIDGSFGRKTRNAVVTFQSSSGIGVDGVVGARTRSALVSKNPTSVNTTPKLRPGSRGDAVKNLQSLLNKAGANIKVDGVFGRGTKTAVRNFQSSAGVGVDGVVGPRTWDKLNSGKVEIATATPASLSTPKKTSTKSDASGEAIVASAKKYLGTPYVWGGSSTSGFDCSGLTSTVYREHGISIPRTARKQAFGGTIISESEAQVGDLVVFTQNNYGHVGIYAGDGKIVDASRSRNQVVHRDIWTSKVIYVTYR